MAVNSPPPSIQLPHHILWPSCHLGPLVEGAMTPTSPELGTAAVGKLLQGAKACAAHYKCPSVSTDPLPVPAISASSLPSDFLQPPPLFLSLLTIARPPPEFLSTEIWTAPLLALLPLGPPKRRKKTVRLHARSSSLNQLKSSSHPQTWIPIERHLRSASLCALLSERCATAEVVAVAVMVMVLLVTCWLAGPCTWALAASMAAVRAFMLSMLSVELDRPGWELMPVRGPEPPSM